MESDLRERMRLGMTGAVRRLGGARRVAGTSLVALLCASALAPVVAAGVVVGPILLAGVGVVGAVGAGALTNVVSDAVNRLRGDGKEVSQDSVENELTQRLEKELASEADSASSLREAVAALLRGVDAMAAVREGAAQDQNLMQAIGEGFAALDQRFSEFTPLIDDVKQTTWEIQQTLLRQEADSRIDREQAREDSLRLVHVLDILERRGVSPAEAADVGSQDPLWAGCPYLGLMPFQQRDARVFYGRNELVDRLVQRLLERLDGGGILLVVGASGAGKSSLLRAGLMPRLSKGALGPGSATWPRRVIRPTASPVRALAGHLANLASLDPVGVYKSLSTAPGETPLLVERAVAAATGSGLVGEADATMAPKRLVLVIDQFEEMFTPSPDTEADQEEKEREAFIEALRAAAAAPADWSRPPSALVVAAVRADFLDRTTGYAPLEAAIQAGLFTVGPMSEAELRQAITGPAAEAGLDAKRKLVDAVVAELRERANGGLGSGALPLMSQAMAATWKLREGDELTLRAYRRAGGIADAVNRSATTAYDTLTDAQKDAARAVFIRLTVVTQDGQLARRPCRRAELYAGQEEITGDIDAVISAFSAQRLLVLGEVSIEISHDVLLNAWTKLSEWIAEDRKRLIARDEVRAEAGRWVSKDRDPSWLVRGRALSEAEDYWSDDPLSINDSLVTEFLIKSRITEMASKYGARSFEMASTLGNTVKMSQKTNDIELQVYCLTEAIGYHLRSFEPFRAFNYWRQDYRLNFGSQETRTSGGEQRPNRRVSSIWVVAAEAFPIPILWLFSWFGTAFLFTTSTNYGEHSKTVRILAAGLVVSLIFWFTRRGFRHPALAFPVVLLISELIVELSFVTSYYAGIPYIKGRWWAAIAVAAFLLLLWNLRQRYRIWSKRSREDL